jgi:hypothetical protein
MKEAAFNIKCCGVSLPKPFDIKCVNCLHHRLLSDACPFRQHYQNSVEIGKRLSIGNANSGDDVLGISPDKVEKK